MDSKKHSSLQILKKNLVSIYKKNKEKIFDIVLFGSIVKGKSFSEDIDICVIFKNKEDMTILKEISSINTEIKLHVTRLSLNELYTEKLWLTILREGFSIIHNKTIIEILNLEAYGLYTYNLTNIKNKSRFSQILKGYKSTSMIEKVNGKLLKPGVILVPIKKVEEFRSFLENWKVKYTLNYIFLEKY